MASKYFDQISIPKSTKRFVDKSLAIGDRLVALLAQKNMTQRQLANKMGKRESEISKWLTGTHNFTLKTISKLETVLGEEIISTKKVTKVYISESVSSHSYYKSEKYDNNRSEYQSIGKVGKIESIEILYA